jgi:hypothetical protein
MFIKTFSWGFPTGWSFTTHSHVNLVLEFLSPLPCIKEEAFTQSSPRHQQVFWRRCRGGKKASARGVLHAHPLLCFKFCFTLFLLASFYQKPKKNSTLYSCYFFTLVHYVVP